MKRRFFIALLGTTSIVGAVVLYNAVAREAEYHRLIAQGEAALTADQTFVAIESFSGAITLKSTSMLAYLKRGEAYRRRGELTSALRDFRKAAQVDPKAPRPLEELGDVNYAMERYANAVENYDKCLRLDDHSARVFYKLGLVRYREGNAVEAARLLRQAITLNDRFAEAHYVLGLCLKDRRATTEAASAFTRAVQVSPGLTAAREELAALFAATNRQAEAIEQLEALAALEPGRPERQVAVGLAYAKSGKTDIAVMALGRAAERHPESAAVYVALGRVWLELAVQRKDRVALNKALEAVDEVSRRPSASSETLAVFGRALIESGDLESAENILEQATARYPVDLSAFDLLVNVAARLEHPDVARDALMRLSMLDLQHTAPRAERAARIAELSMKMKQPADAVLWLRRAIDAGGAPAALWARLVEAQHAAGDRDGARATLEQALQREPTSKTLLALRRLVGVRPRTPGADPDGRGVRRRGNSGPGRGAQWLLPEIPSDAAHRADAAGRRSASSPNSVLAAARPDPEN